ncbi:CES2, partial [Symbiodinium sp. CCMP2456]
SLAGAGPLVETPLGTAEGITAAAGVERFAGIPYALPPVGQRRFAAAVLSDGPWPQGHLDARRLGAPCINNPLGDPRSVPLDEDHAPPPSEDCLQL